MHRVVRKIPLDIYFEILGHVGSPQEYKRALVDMQPDMSSLRNRTIRSMALVCREFYNHFFSRTSTSIVRGDQRARTLARYVKTYAIVDFAMTERFRNYPELEIPALTEHLVIYSKALGFMTNLRELYLFHSSITNDLLRATQSLPPLRLLHIEKCNAPRALDKSLLRSFANLRITNVYERDTAFFDQDGNESEPCFQLFAHFCLSHTKRLEIYDAQFYHLGGLASLPPMVHLQSVHFSRLITDPYLPVFPDALKAMPNLKSLQIDHIVYFVIELAPFNPRPTFPRLPVLENIRAHLPALQAIVPGSLVSSISIAEVNVILEGPLPYEKDGDFWKPVAGAFKKSQRPIEELDIPMSFYCNISFASHFPDLRLLTIRPKHINWFNEHDAADEPFGGQPDLVIAAFLGSWLDHPKLTKLRFAYDRITSPLPTEEEEDGLVRYSVCDVSDDTLAALKLRIPTLQWLTFSVNPPKFPDDEKFEFYLGKEDEVETIDPDLAAATEAGEVL